MKEMSSGAVGIIGGADGPTSVLVAGKNGRAKKIPLKHRIKNRIYKWKRKCAEKQIIAGERTLTEVVTYAVEKYDATEADITQRKYATQKLCLKESLISRYKPEMLGELAEMNRPEDFNPETVKALQDQFLARRERVKSISEEQMPMDFYIYEIAVGEGRLEMEVDYHWNIFGISYSGSKKSMKKMKEIAKDLHLYYGVSEEDIQQKSERYHSLLAILSM